MIEYRPYRVLKTIAVVVDDSDDAIMTYPHGKVDRKTKVDRKVCVIFRAGVIDAPTDEEIALFELPGMSGAVQAIPQDPRGFDVRTSGVARSFGGSKRGREAGIIESLERTARTGSKKKKVKPEKESEEELTDVDVAKEDSYE